MTDDMAADLREAADYLRPLAPSPRIGVVLGSGLAGFADRLEGLVRIPAARVPHMPTPRISGHPGTLCFGQIGRAPVVCLQGRVHLYEGYSGPRVVFGVRLLAELGCRVVLLTNAAGGISAHLLPGDLMIITDHINLMGQNPLVGANDGRGPRFPDLSQAYDPTLLEHARQVAGLAELPLKEGVYAAMLGPSYETPAEIRMLRALGADAVGMSTVPEVIALRHRGIRVGAMSCITNQAAGISPRKLDHAEVAQTAKTVAEAFGQLVSGWIERAFTELA